MPVAGTLKLPCHEFEPIVAGAQPFLFVSEKRPVDAGAVLQLVEFDPLDGKRITGRQAFVKVTCVAEHIDVAGIEKGFLLLGLSLKL